MIEQPQRDLSEALDTVENAARQEKESVRQMIQDKYHYIRDLLGDKREVVGRQMRRGQERAKEAAAEVDEQVHKHPWPYLAGAVVSAFVFGILLGKTGNK